MRRTLLGLVAALLVTAGGVAVARHSAGLARSATAPVRIMPLGDSITGSPGCWRALLWNRLRSNGFTNIDFVGTLPPQGCGVAYDVSWNGALAPGAGTTFGFLGSWTGSNPVPTVSCT